MIIQIIALVLGIFLTGLGIYNFAMRMTTDYDCSPKSLNFKHLGLIASGILIVFVDVLIFALRK